MARTSIQPDERQRRWIRWLPPAALILAGVYLLSLHPATGHVGGIVYLLTGWLIPSALNVVLSVWVALLPRMHWSLRIPIGVLVSFVLGMNTLLPAVLLPDASPRAEIVVSRPVPVAPGLAVDARLMPMNPHNPYNTAIERSPLGPKIGSDEGCMCMHWVSRGGWLLGQVRAVIEHRHFHDADGVHIFSSQFPDAAPYNEIVHFSVDFAPTGTQNDLVDMTVDVYQGFDKVASYRQRGLPVEARNERMNRPLNEHFLRNSWSMLIHRNLWTLFLPDHWQQGWSAAQFNEFLTKAIPPVPSHAPASDAPVFATGSKGFMQPANPLPPVPAGPGLKTLVISPDPGAGVDWVVVSTNEKDGDEWGYSCDIAALPDGAGRFVARIGVDRPPALASGCNWRPERVEVRLFSNGFYVGDVSLPEETVRDNGVFQGICVFEWKSLPDGMRSPPPCTRNEVGAEGAWDSAREATLRALPESKAIRVRVEVSGNYPDSGLL